MLKSSFGNTYCTYVHFFTKQKHRILKEKRDTHIITNATQDAFHEVSKDTVKSGKINIKSGFFEEPKNKIVICFVIYSTSSLSNWTEW